MLKSEHLRTELDTLTALYMCRVPAIHQEVASASQPGSSLPSQPTNRLFDKEPDNQYEEPLLVAQEAAKHLRASLPALPSPDRAHLLDWLSLCMSRRSSRLQRQVRSPCSPAAGVQPLLQGLVYDATS